MKPQQTPPTSTEYVEPFGFKGTKGIWEIDNELNGEFSELMNEEKVIAHIYNQKALYGINKNEAAANDKLISQSKELAKALQDMIELVSHLRPDPKLKSAKHFEVIAKWYETESNAKQVLKQAGLKE